MTLALFALLACLWRAFAAPCPPPDAAHTTGPPAAVTPDGAAHLLARDAVSACWWIVDDGGDAHVAGRWDRARRDPAALLALADGRAVVVLREGARWRLGVRAEGGGERRLDVDLPGPPARVLAHPDRPLVAVAWAGRDHDVVWLVAVDAGGVTVATTPPGAAAALAFAADALTVPGGLALTSGEVTVGGADAPR